MRLVPVPSVAPEQVRGIVREVVEGADLALYGGDGPLLSALHLSRFDTRVEGGATPLLPLLPPLPPSTLSPVTGVGYALYRSNDLCVALAGPRGLGRVLFLGCDSAQDPLAVACLEWFSLHGMHFVRSVDRDG